MDNKFIKQFKATLTKVSDLLDVTYIGDNGGRYRFDDYELERLRNEGGPFVEMFQNGRTVRVYRSRHAPTYDAFAAHLVQQGQKTIWITNDDRKKTLLMLADIDDKHGTGDAAGAADYLSRTYLKGNTLIEASTGGKGRHVYFFARVGNIPRSAFCDRVHLLADRIRSDEAFERFGVKFDNVFYGLPSVWDWDQGKKVWTLRRRGDCLRLPYLDNGQADLDRLSSLPVLLPDQFLPSKEYCHTHIALIHRGTSGDEGTQGKTKGDPDDLKRSGDALTKKYRCVDQMLQRTNGTASVDDVLDDYLTNWNPSTDGDTEADRRNRRKLLAKLLTKRLKTFIPAQKHQGTFQRDEHLKQIEQAVPAADFDWNRRELLNHRRLSDFISIKLQDAFFVKNSDEWFARAARDVTIRNSRAMKAKGLIDWTLNNSTYKRLLDIAVRHGFLTIYEDFQRPSLDHSGRKIGKGKPRLIGPGDAFPDLKQKWISIYNEHKQRQRLRSLSFEAVAA